MLLPPNYDFYFEIGEGLYLLLYLVKQQDELKQIVLDRTSDIGEKNLEWMRCFGLRHKESYFGLFLGLVAFQTCIACWDTF